MNRLKTAIDNGILFLCVANSARSQIAEGLARQVFGSSINVQSAGSKPAKVHPFAVEAMKEIGMDISSYRSKSFDDVDMSRVGLVITLCIGEILPAGGSAAMHLYWFLPNPAIHQDDQPDLDSFRATRDDLRLRISMLHGEYISMADCVNDRMPAPVLSHTAAVFSSFRRLSLRYGLYLH